MSLRELKVERERGRKRAREREREKHRDKDKERNNKNDISLRCTHLLKQFPLFFTKICDNLKVEYTKILHPF